MVRNQSFPTSQAVTVVALLATVVLILQLLRVETTAVIFSDATNFRVGFVRPENTKESMDVKEDFVSLTSQIQIGMLAAFQEANEEAAMLEAGTADGSIRLTSIGAGNRIELLTADITTGDETTWVDPTFPQAKDLIQNYSVDVLTASFFGGDATVLEGLRSQVPVVAPQVVTNLQKVYDPEVEGPEIIHWKLPVSDELGALFNLGMNGEARCTNFGFVFPLADAVETATEVGVEAFAEQNGINVSYGVVGTGLAETQDITEVLAFFSQYTEETMPQCFIFFAQPDVVISTIVFAKIYFPAAQFENMYWFAGSAAALPNYATFTGSSDDFDKLYIANQYPNPRDTSYLFIQRYHAALEKFVESGNITQVAGRTSPSANTTNPTEWNIEGYAIGRFIIAGLSRTQNNFTGAGFLQAIYGTQLFRIDDIVLGPYSYGCPGALASASDDTCYCNVGAKKVFIGRVNPETNLLDPVKDSLLLGESGVATMEVPSSACSALIIRDVKRNMWVGYYDESSGTGIAASGATAFSTELEQSLYLLKKERQAELGISTSVDVANSTSAQLTLGKRVPMALVVGGSGSNSPNNSAVEVTNFDIPVLARDVVTSDMPLTDPATWNRTTSPSFDPVLTDYIHTAAAFAHSNYGGRAPTILAATQQMADFAKQSVETFTGSNVDTGDITVYGSTPPSLADYKSGTLVLVVDQRLSALSAMLDSLPSVSTGATFVFAVPEHQVFTAATSSSAIASVITSTRSVYFTTVLSGWWEGATTSSSSLVLSWRSLHGYNSSVYPSPAVLRAFRSAVLLDEAGDKLTKGFSQSELLSTLYSIGSFSVDEASVGSFSADTCISAEEAASPSRRCQCGKGPRKFHVHNLADAVSPSTSSTGSSGFAYSVAACGIQQIEVPVDYTLALVLGIGLPIAVLAALFIYKLTRPPRDNSCAPKKADQPFCILFTDIQSSTSLWARIPEVMAQAVETHHEIMREQIDKFKGYEVKTIGDSFMVAFQEPKDALKFSLSAQQALQDSAWQGDAASINSTYYDLEAEWIEKELAANPETPPVQLLKGQQAPTWDEFRRQLEAARSTSIWSGLRVRIGIHYGTGSIQLDPVSLGYDYYGTVVNTAARVESVGHGGQIAVTGAVLQAVIGENNPLSSSTIGQSPTAPPLSPRSAAEMKPLPAPWNATRMNLGMVPLRGLSDPVLLTQIMSSTLCGRVFPKLRVDQAPKEVDDDDKSSQELEADSAMSVEEQQQDTASDRYSMTGGMFTGGIGSVTSPGGGIGGNLRGGGGTEAVAEAYARKSVNHRSVALTAIKNNFQLFKLVHGLAQPDQYSATLEHLSTRWGLGRNARADLKKNKDGQDKVLMELVARGMLAHEEKLRKAKLMQKGNDLFRNLDSSDPLSSKESSKDGLMLGGSSSSPQQEALQTGVIRLITPVAPFLRADSGNSLSSASALGVSGKELSRSDLSLVRLADAAKGQNSDGGGALSGRANVPPPETVVPSEL